MLICMSILIYILIQTQSDQTFTHVGKNLIDRVIVWMSWRKHETCRDHNIPWNIPGLRNQPY